LDKRDIGGDSFWSVDDLTPPMGKKKRMTEKAIVYDAKEMPVDKKVQNTEKPSFSYTTAVHPKRGGLLASRRQNAGADAVTHVQARSNHVASPLECVSKGLFDALAHGLQPNFPTSLDSFPFCTRRYSSANFTEFSPMQYST